MSTRQCVEVVDTQAQGGERWDIAILLPSSILASLEIAKPIVPRILLTLDKLLQLAHAVFASTAEFQWLPRIVHEYPHVFILVLVVMVGPMPIHPIPPPHGLWP